MKKIALAAALSVAATTAYAGGMAPVMETEIVEAATSSSSAGVVVGLMLLLVIAAVAAN